VIENQVSSKQDPKMETAFADRAQLSPFLSWKLKLGAEAIDGGVRFRVWAPLARNVSVCLEDGSLIPLQAEKNGYFSDFVENLKPGTLYQYQINSQNKYPDPCSRFQPEGPHGPSQIVDPDSFLWSDEKWPGLNIKGQIFYEIHIGTFTPEGTFDAAIKELPELKRIGVTVLEIMPIAEWAGRWNWGYDGVNLFAPTHNYGDAEAFKRFVNAAHENGLGVILDVVYNHLGPDGNYLGFFSKDYFTQKYKTDWGAAINFDGPASAEVREYFLSNACYWVSEFHLDGLRLDATQNIYDSGPLHILAELSNRARAAASPRQIILIGENEPQNVRCLSSTEAEGFGLDAVWADDFHHEVRVATTSFREAYFTDYLAKPQEFVSALKRGYLFQGQYYEWQKKTRGTPVNKEPASSFIFYIQNHDQIANHIDGDRLHKITPLPKYRALSALFLLAPETPMLFMGQEFAASSPFLFFADHCDELGEKVRAGRNEFLAQFPSYSKPEVQTKIPDPCIPETFQRCKLDFSERHKHAELYLFHQDLIALRKKDSVLALQSRQIDGAVLSEKCFAIRYFGKKKGDDRLLIVNYGEAFAFSPSPEPLLAPPLDRNWKLSWTSEDPKYGGADQGPFKFWQFPECCALFFVASRNPKKKESPHGE
jgi:maltooligosyltrehalose trehalohydrolase